MTKTQVRKRISETLERLWGLRSELEETRDDLLDTMESIEPYEGRSELTERQQERYEWFDELESKLSDLISALEDNMADVLEQLED